MQQDMTQHMMVTPKLTLSALLTASAITGAMLASPALAQNLTVTPGQKATAEQVAQAGVPLSELAADAPDEYTIKRGDTLWAISGLYLKRPWRWPELWGMNLQEIKNPHRIYPGQKLYLEKKDGRPRFAPALPRPAARRLTARYGCPHAPAMRAWPTAPYRPSNPT